MSSTDTTTLFVRAFNPSIKVDDRYTMIQDLFKDFCELTEDDITLIENREYGGYKNFCFVKVPTDKAAEIVKNLNGQPLDDGLELVVNVAEPREAKPAGGSYGNKGGGSYGNSSRSGGGYNSNSRGGGGSDSYSRGSRY